MVNLTIRDILCPMQIHITSIPPGEAPENIRAAWVGLILPLADPGPETTGTESVLSRKTDTENGFAVNAVQAIEILESHSPDAARWWRENASSCIQPGQQLVFSTESCQEMPDEFEYFGTYRNSDARRLLDALAERDIRFEIEIDDSAIKPKFLGKVRP